MKNALVYYNIEKVEILRDKVVLLMKRFSERNIQLSPKNFWKGLDHIYRKR